MMIAEGFIAMTWAAAAMGVMNLGLANADTPATNVVGIVANSLLAVSYTHLDVYKRQAYAG